MQGRTASARPCRDSRRMRGSPGFVTQPPGVWFHPHEAPTGQRARTIRAIFPRPGSSCGDLPPYLEAQPPVLCSWRPNPGRPGHSRKGDRVASAISQVLADQGRASQLELPGSSCSLSGPAGPRPGALKSAASNPIGTADLRRPARYRRAEPQRASTCRRHLDVPRLSRRAWRPWRAEDRVAVVRRRFAVRCDSRCLTVTPGGAGRLVQADQPRCKPRPARQLRRAGLVTDAQRSGRPTGQRFSITPPAEATADCRGDGPGREPDRVDLHQARY